MDEDITIDLRTASQKTDRNRSALIHRDKTSTLLVDNLSNDKMSANASSHTMKPQPFFGQNVFMYLFMRGT